MLLRNISTEKTMQVDSQIWYCLEICGEKERREIFISLLDEEISGITENNDNDFSQNLKVLYSRMKNELKGECKTKTVIIQSNQLKKVL